MTITLSVMIFLLALVCSTWAEIEEIDESLKVRDDDDEGLDLWNEEAGEYWHYEWEAIETYEGLMTLIFIKWIRDHKEMPEPERKQACLSFFFGDQIKEIAQSYDLNLMEYIYRFAAANA